MACGEFSWTDAAAWLGVITGFAGAYIGLRAIFVSINIARNQAEETATAALAERKEPTRRASWSAAMAAYQGYLQLGVRHPNLASGETVAECERSSYVWYLSALCFAAEQILNAYDIKTPEREVWIKVLYEQFQRHKGAFTEALMATKLDVGEKFATFSHDVQTLIIGDRPD